LKIPFYEFIKVTDSNIVMLAIPVNSGRMVRMVQIQCVPGKVD
jgi:hypothetical protein